MPNLEEANRLLAAAPGPSPWYLRSETPCIDSRWGPLTWRQVGIAFGLFDPAGEARLLLAMYGFSMKLSAELLLVWYKHDDAMKFHLVDVSALQPIAAVQQTAAIMKEHKLPLVMMDPSLQAHTVELAIQPRVDSGQLAVGMPVEMEALEEIVFFANLGKTSLWVMKPRMGLLEVIPQDWFNNGTFDFGYQWPTRAARDPVSHRFVGDGIRLGVFILDESGRNVEAWLAEN